MIVEASWKDRNAGFALLKLGGFMEIDGKRCVKTGADSYVVIEGNEQRIAEPVQFSSLPNGAAFQCGASHLIKNGARSAVYLASGNNACFEPGTTVTALPHAKVVLGGDGELPF